jgi:phage-related protein
MAGPEEASQGTNGLMRDILSVVKAFRTAVSKISDIKTKVSEIEKSVQARLSYSRTPMLCSGQSPTKDATSLE